jgi:hypothetical protein
MASNQNYWNSFSWWLEEIATAKPGSSEHCQVAGDWSFECNSKLWERFSVLLYF